MLLTFKALNGMAPEFIRDLIEEYVPSRALRSSSQNFLRVQRASTKFYGKRSFAVASAVEWNRLPADLRHAQTVSVFKSRLKTLLFRQCFPE